MSLALLTFLSVTKMNKNNFMQEFIMLYATTDHAQIVFFNYRRQKVQKSSDYTSIFVKF
ncbi:Uncharacterised protein [Streptococcus pyogenes]|nr:Uncharacterised protein [Streptococcus pyogenes]VGV83345.1 Uncharacterised protein [Streptococcus pyogenes]VGV98409.1 Uncharacterised protein [Streptococcus pyogenes]VGW35696.1 Uncharacterised protein [Streptococcus pyogenes]VGW44337.1 Uncharacterised protein [Streptococcus pyogenes]